MHLKKGIAKLKQDGDILIDQVKAIDKMRLQGKLGSLPEEIEEKIKRNLALILDLWCHIS